MGNIAFVASTLPVPLLKKYMNKWEISEIIVTSKSLAHSYEFLLENKPNIKIIIASLIFDYDNLPNDFKIPS